MESNEFAVAEASAYDGAGWAQLHYTKAILG
jgi:hypothetical protein